MANPSRQGSESPVALCAALPLEVDTNDGPQVLAFHSLRGTYATLRDGLDISLKARQDLMQHSDPRLTTARYARTRLHDLGAVVDKLPKPTTPTTELAALRMTGTDPTGPVREQLGTATGGSGRVQSRTGEDVSPSEGETGRVPKGLEVQEIGDG